MKSKFPTPAGPRRSALVIAVFGGTDSPSDSVLSMAQGLGHEIACRGAVPLSGGTEPNRDAVKNAVILGAHQGEENPLPWIGVARTKRSRLASEKQEQVTWDLYDRVGFRLVSDLGNKRNYLEAYMADAAVALPGGDGTISEVASSLSLHRPVAIVEGDWETRFDLIKDQATAISILVERTMNKFASARPSRALDHELTDTTLSSRLASLPPVKYFAESESPGRLIDWVMQILSERQPPLMGEFPLVEGHEVAKGAYDAWSRLVPGISKKAT